MKHLTKKSSRVGIILAGGNGTRLAPLTTHISKQLLPLYDKPIIFYSLTSLILLGIREVLIIVKPDEQRLFEKLLGHGEDFGIRIDYTHQNEPKGIAEAFLLASNEIENRNTCLMLGDNFFYGAGVGRNLAQSIPNEGATVLAVHSSNPSDYGVIEYGKNDQLKKIWEKPKNPPSNWIVPGMYFYDSSAVERARKLKPSSRGELEITDLNNDYLNDGKLGEVKLLRGTAWFDLGTVENLQAAAEFVKAVQSSQGILIGSPYEAGNVMRNNLPLS